MNAYRFAAQAVCAVHLAWVAFVILGPFFCFRRPVGKWIHLGTIVYGVGIEIFQWTCPLTRLEYHFMERAGMESPDEDFLTRMLSGIVYPGFPQWLLIAGAAVVLGYTLYLDFVHERLFAKPAAGPA